MVLRQTDNTYRKTRSRQPFIAQSKTTHCTPKNKYKRVTWCSERNSLSSLCPTDCSRLDRSADLSKGESPERASRRARASAAASLAASARFSLTAIYNKHGVLWVGTGNDGDLGRD